MFGIGAREFRRLGRHDLAAARAHLEALDPEDRYLRFHQDMQASDFDAWQQRASDHLLIGCYSRGRLCGLAEIVLDGAHAEAALSVDEDMRNRGIGTELFERACGLVHRKGATHLSMLVARGDRAMLGIAARYGGVTTFRRGTSLLMPGPRHSMLNWICFDLSAPESQAPQRGAMGWVRRALGMGGTNPDDGYAARD